MSSEVDIREHLNNLIEVLIALSPSRNYITQFIIMLPQDYPTLYDAYPEILKDEKIRNTLAQSFGVSLGSTISVSGGLGNEIRGFITRIFSIFEDENIRKQLDEFLKDIRTDPVPNLKEEWIELKIKGVSMEPTYGNDALRLLKLLAEIKEPIAFRCDLSELVSKTGIDEVRIRRIMEFLITKFQLVAKDDRAGKEGYNIQWDIQKYIPGIVARLS